MRFVDLTPALILEIEHWFDDTDTRRYVFGRKELRRQLALRLTQPGSEFRGVTVTGRYSWVAYMGNQPIGYLGVETYADASASFVIVVDPQTRGKGIGTRILSEIQNVDELRSTDVLEAGVEPDNLTCIAALKKAGFDISPEPDEEGFLAVTWQRT